MKPKLLIVGASVRAQIQSAIRAGYPVEGWDLFADHDTRVACQQAGPNMAAILNIESFDQVEGEVARARSTNIRQPDVAIVCGGVEQHAEAIAAIEDWLPIAGCSTESMAQFAKRERLHDVIEAAGCKAAPTFDRLPDQATPSDWLRKPIVSGGGLAIRVAVDSDLSGSGSSSDYIFQQRIAGESFSALYVAKDRHSLLVGCTRQLVGDDRFTDSPFAWCGSLGPIRLSADCVSRLSTLGNSLTQDFGLRGVFGVDFILNEQSIWPVDINARITGSAEVFESFDRENNHPRAFNMIKAQLEQLDIPSCSPQNLPAAEKLCGKAIVFNQTGNSISVTGEVFENLLEIEQAGIRISDVPNMGVTIGPNEPITTVQTTGSDQQGIESALVSAAQQVRRCLT